MKTTPTMFSGFADFRNDAEKAKPIALALALYGSSFYFTYQIIETCPLPREIVRTVYRVSTGYTPDLLPVFFWDFSTMIDPKWLKDHDLIIPYEKGPPEKLLSKIIFRNSKTKQFELEFNGRRPRSYPQDKVYELFNKASNSAATTSARSELTFIGFMNAELAFFSMLILLIIIPTIDLL